MVSEIPSKTYLDRNVNLGACEMYLKDNKHIYGRLKENLVLLYTYMLRRTVKFENAPSSIVSSFKQFIKAL